MIPHCHHDGLGWRYGPTYPTERWAREHCKKKGLLFSELPRPRTSLFLKKKRPTLSKLLEKLNNVVREHLEEENDIRVKISGDYISWKENKDEDLMIEKEHKVVDFSVGFKFESSR